MENIKKIYCDFDGTITKNDAVNGFFEKYAPKEWLDSEKLWVEGKISSRENAMIQVGLLPSLSDEQVNDYIQSIEIDEYFLDFVKYLKENEIELVILSDGFDLFIKETLKRFGLNDIKFYANHLVHKEDGKFKIEFPYYNDECDIKAGMCKCNKVKEDEFAYIGDGTSDLCVAKKAKILFAKDTLCKNCIKIGLNYYKFSSFCDIISMLKTLRGENDNIM